MAPNLVPGAVRPSGVLLFRVRNGVAGPQLIGVRHERQLGRRKQRRLGPESHVMRTFGSTLITATVRGEFKKEEGFLITNSKNYSN